MDIIEIEPDIIDIDDNINLSKPIKLSTSSDNIDIIDTTDDLQSSNFGSGIELLMNDKNKNEPKSKTSIDIDDIAQLENELNDLSDLTDNNVREKKEATNKTIFSGLFGNKKDGKNIKEIPNNEPSLGKSTVELNENKTWDGYGKFSNVPLSNDYVNKKPELTKEEELKEKFKYLRKFDELEKKGVTTSKRYNMDSDLQEMIGEYETILSEKERQNSVKFQGKMLMACITGIEFLNNRFDPFDIKLDGWGEQINENIDDYDEIFGELHEKYKSKAKLSPELKLLFQLGGSAIMVHMSNTMFKSAMPGMDDIMRQNPELMKQFTQAAVNTMGENNPGFGGFMNNVFNGQGNSNQSNRENVNRQNGLGSGANPGFGGLFSQMGMGNRDMPPTSNVGPPPPTETKLPERSKRTQNMSNRPDLMRARGEASSNDSRFEEIGTSISSNYGDANNEDKILRPEMKGPSSNIKQSEINSLLSGLKNKQNVETKEVNQASTISVEDLKDLTNVKIPKTKRKQKSDKNIVSLDI